MPAAKRAKAKPPRMWTADELVQQYGAGAYDQALHYMVEAARAGYHQEARMLSYAAQELQKRAKP